MNIQFPKDILIIDFEAFWGSNDTTQPFQIGAILLDKATLEEKKFFVSFIQTDLSNVPQEKIIKTVDPEEIARAPQASQVAEEIIQLFGTDYLLSSWAAELDIKLFRKLMFAAGIEETIFDYHIYDLWPVAYTYLLEHGYTGSWRSEAMFQEFGLPARGTHDALEDCRHAAQILRKVLTKE